MHTSREQIVYAYSYRTILSECGGSLPQGGEKRKEKKKQLIMTPATVKKSKLSCPKIIFEYCYKQTK